MFIYCTNSGRIEFQSKDEFVKFKRGFEEFKSDEEMVKYLDERGVFYDGGWRREFIDFYISDYCLNPIYDYLTEEEVERLKAYQAKLIAEHEAAEAAKEWRKVETLYWADNSIEEVWEDKDGNRKTIMTVGPHGDAC